MDPLCSSGLIPRKEDLIWQAGFNIKINYNRAFLSLLRLQKHYLILTSYSPSARAVQGNIGPRSWQYGCTKTSEGQYSPVRLEQARLVSSLLYGIVFLSEETLPVISLKSTSGAMSVDLMTRATQKRVEQFTTRV